MSQLRGVSRPNEYEDFWVMISMHHDIQVGRTWPFAQEDQARRAAQGVNKFPGCTHATAAYVFPPLGVEAETYVVNFQ